MVEKALLHTYLPIDEFLAAEEAASVRHEYVGGVLHALAGGTDWHNGIVANLVSHLRPPTWGTDCRVYANDMLLRIRDEVMYYPDLMMVCDPADQNRLYRTNPCLEIEVLSPPTASTDRREKQLAYRQPPNPLSYLVVSRDERRVERNYRGLPELWRSEVIIESGSIAVPCPEIELPPDNVYRDIDWSEE